LQRNWLGKGIQPQAPDLAETAGQRTRAEIYQALKYGIRFTGMPALAPTHSDEEIGEITAFVLALANMSPEQYQRLRASETHEDSSEKPGIQAHDDEHLHHH
jgi:mono/diheme cytochrome c family protein